MKCGEERENEARRTGRVGRDAKVPAEMQRARDASALDSAQRVVSGVEGRVPPYSQLVVLTTRTLLGPLLPVVSGCGYVYGW
jgi:hypothetical protein